MLLKNEKGLILIDLLIVILIVGIVMAVLIPQWKAQEESQNQQVCRDQMLELATGEEQYRETHGLYTDSMDELAQIIPDQALMTCPSNDLKYTLAATDSTDYSITCPNNHGIVKNGEANWTKKK